MKLKRFGYGFQPLDKPRNRQPWVAGSIEAESELGPSSLLSSLGLGELRLKTFLPSLVLSLDSRYVIGVALFTLEEDASLSQRIFFNVVVWFQ